MTRGKVAGSEFWLESDDGQLKTDVVTKKGKRTGFGYEFEGTIDFDEIGKTVKLLPKVAGENTDKHMKFAVDFFPIK